MAEKTVKKVVDVSFHRNGIYGVGFYSILFMDSEEGLMHASLFDESGYCAVHKVSLLAEKNIAFGSNSWRGDNFEHELRPLVEAWLSKNDSNRIGPFALPA